MKRNLVLVCAVLVLVLTGCKGGSKESKKQEGFVPALDVETECVIRVDGSYTNFESLEEEFSRFNEYYPKVELVYTSLDFYNNSIFAALKGDDAPDIYAMFTWMIDKEGCKPLFDSAQDLSDSSLGLDLDCIRQKLIYADSDGKISMLPVFATAKGMMVNEDLFKKEGLKIPSTYSELISVSKKLISMGYDTPILSYNDESGTWYTFAYQYFCKSLRGNPDAVRRMNALEPSAGEYMRPVLEHVEEFSKSGVINEEACAALKDNYSAVIQRFFEGDIPMVFMQGDRFSGTKKRESLSPAFIEQPFTYSFHAIPTSEANLCFFIDAFMAFAVNKDSKNLDMADEFMRFLVTTEELNNMAKNKRLITVSNNYSFDEVYSSLDSVETAYIQDVGLFDNALKQVRRAVYNVGNGWMSVQEAIDNFGNF